MDGLAPLNTGRSLTRVGSPGAPRGTPDVRCSSQNPIPSGPLGHATFPPGAPTSHLVSRPSVESRSACGHEKASWDQLVGAGESNDAQKAHD